MGAHTRSSQRRSSASTAVPTTIIATRTARQRGLTDSARRHAVRSGVLDRPRRDVVAPPPTPAPGTPPWDRVRADLLRAATAARQSCPRAVVSHAAAAVARDLPVLVVPPRPCLTVQAGTALRRLVEAHLHRATLTADDLATASRLAMTSVARTVLDVAREDGVLAGLVVADAALHRGEVSEQHLLEALGRCEGWPGFRAARRVVAEADGRTESPLETRSRWAMLLAGLPRPSTQVPLVDAAGRFVGRPDFYWDEFGVAGEADGDGKYDDREEQPRQRKRHTALEETGLLVVRWGPDDLPRFFGTTRRLEDAFTRGARAGSPLRRWSVLPRPSR